ncbi:MAG: TonB-dependent receptor [Chitinophagaceae bacterium]
MINYIINSAKVTLNFTKHIFFTGQFGLDYDNTTYTTKSSVTRILPVVANGSFVITWNYTERFSVSKMNRGQVRFAWADVGNGTNRYFANNQYSIGYITGTGVSATSITLPGSLLPGSLKPERKREFEVGINNSFFDQNRLTVDVSYYTNNKYDQIIGLPISASSSSSSLKINAANMRTWGFEFSVMGSPVVIKDLRWNITINGARQGSKVLGLYSDLQAYTYGNLINNNSGAASIRADVGRPFGEIKMYDFVRDDNGNKVVSNSGLYSLDAQKTIIAGNIMPKLYGGILSDLRYKSFNFRIGLDYKSGGTVFSYTNMRMTGLGQLSSTLQYRDEKSGGMAYYIDAAGKKTGWQHNVAAPAGAQGGRVYHDGLILPGTKLDATSHYVTNDVITSATSYYEFYANDLASSFPPDRLYKNNYERCGYTFHKLLVCH